MMAVIVVENGDLTIFDQVEDAEKYIEPIDVKNNEYVINDNLGFVWNASIINNNNIEYIKISKSKKRDLRSLEQAVIDFLSYIEPKKNWRSIDTYKVIDYAIDNYSEGTH